MSGGKYVIGELINRCSPLVNHIFDDYMDLSNDAIKDLNKLKEKMSLSYAPDSVK